MTSYENSIENRPYGEGAQNKLDQIKENRRIERLEKLIADSPAIIIIGDPYEKPEAVKVWTASTLASANASLPRRDGAISDGNSRDVLDVATGSDNCCVTSAEAVDAETAWDEGQVLATNPNWEANRPALVIPGTEVTLGQVGEALGRHFGADASLAEQAA